MNTKQIWNKYHQDVKYFVFSKVKDKHITDDLVQDIFIKIHTKIETLNDNSKLKSWLFSIANYSVVDHFRGHKNSSELTEFDVEMEDLHKSHDKKDCLHGIIKRLPKKYRDPLFLSDIKGVKQMDVAKQLKLELPTAKSRIQRARKLIAQGYMECCDFKMNQQGYLVGEVKDKEECKVCG